MQNPKVKSRSNKRNKAHVFGQFSKWIQAHQQVPVQFLKVQRRVALTTLRFPWSTPIGYAALHLAHPSFHAMDIFGAEERSHSTLQPLEILLWNICPSLQVLQPPHIPDQYGTLFFFPSPTRCCDHHVTLLCPEDSSPNPWYLPVTDPQVPKEMLVSTCLFLWISLEHPLHLAPSKCKACLLWPAQEPQHLNHQLLPSTPICAENWAFLWKNPKLPGKRNPVIADQTVKGDGTQSVIWTTK